MVLMRSRYTVTRCSPMLAIAFVVAMAACSALTVAAMTLDL